MGCNPTTCSISITNIIPHSPDDGSLVPKNNCVDFDSQ